MEQLKANISNILAFIQMSPDELGSQLSYQDAIAYLMMYNIPPPELRIPVMTSGNNPGVEALFTIGGYSIQISAVLLVFNPMPVVIDMLHAGIIPMVYPKPYVPPSHEIPPPIIDLTNLQNALGPLMMGWEPKRKALTAPFQGQVTFGTFVTDITNGEKWELIDPNNLFNKMGVWQYMGQDPTWIPAGISAGIKIGKK